MTSAPDGARRLRQLVGGSQRAHQALQEAAIRMLALYGLPAVPVHTGPRVSVGRGGAVELRGNAAQRGLADVLTCLPPSGRLVLLEFKTGGARRSTAQVEMHERFRAAGALCLVVRDVETMRRELGLTHRLPPAAIEAMEATGMRRVVDSEEAHRFVRARMSAEQIERLRVISRRIDQNPRRGR